MRSDVHRLRSMRGHDLADQNKAGLPQMCIGCADATALQVCVSVCVCV